MPDMTPTDLDCTMTRGEVMRERELERQRWLAQKAKRERETGRERGGGGVPRVRK